VEAMSGVDRFLAGRTRLLYGHGAGCNDRVTTPPLWATFLASATTVSRDFSDLLLRTYPASGVRTKGKGECVASYLWRGDDRGGSSLGAASRSLWEQEQRQQQYGRERR